MYIKTKKNHKVKLNVIQKGGSSDSLFLLYFRYFYRGFNGNKIKGGGKHGRNEI